MATGDGRAAALLERERDFIRDALTCCERRSRSRSDTPSSHGRRERRQRSDDLGIVIDELGRISSISDRLLLLAGASYPHFLEREPVDVGRLVRTVGKRWEGTALTEPGASQC